MQISRVLLVIELYTQNRCVTIWADIYKETELYFQDFLFER